MKTRWSAFGVLVAMVLCLTALAFAGQPDSATGAGFFDGSDRVFAFTATRHMDGMARGQGVLILPEIVTFHYAVNCLDIQGNVATLSGIITKNDWVGTDFDATGSNFWFRVVDSGEGRKAAKDEMTLFAFDEAPGCEEDCVPDCNSDFPVGTFPISSGNIQVRQADQ